METDYEIQFENHRVSVNRPAIFFCQPLVPYRIETESTERTGYWCVFKGSLLNTIDSWPAIQELFTFSPENNGIFFLDDEQHAKFRLLFMQIIEQLNTDFRFRLDMMKSYINLMICEMVKLQSQIMPLHKSDASSRLAKNFFRLLNNEFRIQSTEKTLSKKKPSDYAHELFVHVNHLNHVIKELTGKSTSAHIVERMVDEAKALLKYTDWNIADIAYALGFEYPNHFNTHFKKHTGTTPALYRSL